MTEDDFFDLCRRADPLQLERDANGTITVMPPSGSYSSNRNLRIANQLQQWADEQNQGVVFDSSGGFTLPNGATRAPDAAWVARSRLEALPKDVKEKFLPLAPDFAVEVRSQSDRRSDLEAKMQEYVENGTRLAWLVDPSEKSVAVYREDGTVETHEHPDTLSGEPVLPNFVCEFERVWNPNY
jgi:Uma2 family endonuclease